MSKVYRGKYSDGNYHVTANQQMLTSPHTRKHGCNFSWGCIDHGTRYLAQALLLDLGYADDLMTNFALNCVAGFDDNWTFSETELRNLINKISIH